MYPHRLLSHIKRQIGNYGWLTITLLMMMLVRPFVTAEGEGGLLTDLLFIAVFLSGIYATRREQYRYWVAILLGGVGLAGRIHLRLSDATSVVVLANAATMLFFAHALLSVASHIWTERHRVNHDVINAAVSAYLLLGMVWAYGYLFLEMAHPGSFKGPHPVMDRDDFYYFSFVTLATLGYGDIIPMTRPARSLAVVEAVTGQLYLAILIGRLVGAYVTQLGKRD